MKMRQYKHQRRIITRDDTTDAISDACKKCPRSRIAMTRHFISQRRRRLRVKNCRQDIATSGECLLAPQKRPGYSHFYMHRTQYRRDSPIGQLPCVTRSKRQASQVSGIALISRSLIRLEVSSVKLRQALILISSSPPRRAGGAVDDCASVHYACDCECTSSRRSLYDCR